MPEETEPNKSFWNSNLLGAIVVIVIAAIGLVFGYGGLNNQQNVNNKQITDIQTKLDDNLEAMRKDDTNQKVQIAIIQQTLETQSEHTNKALENQNNLLIRMNTRIDQFMSNNENYRRQIQSDLDSVNKTLERIVGHPSND